MPENSHIPWTWASHSPFASVPQVRGLLAYATVSSSNAILKDLNAWHNSLFCLGITNLPLSWGQNIFPVLVTLQSCLLLSSLLALSWLGVPIRFSLLAFLPWCFGDSWLDLFFWDSECAIYKHIQHMVPYTARCLFKGVLRRYPSTIGCQSSWNSHIWTECEFILKWAYVSCSVNSSVKQTFVKHPLYF